jgi:hypothetical protein
METNHFINLGYGWLCKTCSGNNGDVTIYTEHSSRARFFSEGEAESKEPRLSTEGLAQWADSSRQKLVCSSCAIEEVIPG